MKKQRTKKSGEIIDIPLKAMIQAQKTEKVMTFFKTRNTSWSARISLLFQALPRDAEQAK